MIDRDKDQIRTRLTSIASIMKRVNFRLGVEDVRLGRSARFDEFDDPWWSYERGRQFATIAPTSMPIKIDGKVNPKAEQLYRAALKRGIIS